MSKHIRLVLLIFVLVACQPSSEQFTATVKMAHAQTQTAAPTLTPMCCRNFFFSACAFLDANGNGVWDESDTPIEGAQMGLRPDGEQAFVLGDLTRSDGCAQVWAPGDDIEVPFTIRMDPPEESDLIPIGESEVVYEGGPHPRFLFREP
jgi:hypothetical protein